MNGPQEVQLLAMQKVQEFLDTVEARDREHLVNMLMALVSATVHIIAAVGDHETGAIVCDKVADHMRTKPRLPRVAEIYGEKAKTATVEGNNTIN